MGMSTHIKGFRPPDAKWHQMKEVWDACTRAKVKVPDDVAEFFGYEEPDPAGVEVDLGSVSPSTLRAPMPGPLTEYHEEGRSGIEVDLTKLPANVKRLRFYNSW